MVHMWGVHMQELTVAMQNQICGENSSKNGMKIKDDTGPTPACTYENIHFPVHKPWTDRTLQCPHNTIEQLREGFQC